MVRDDKGYAHRCDTLHIQKPTAGMISLTANVWFLHFLFMSELIAIPRTKQLHTTSSATSDTLHKYPDLAFALLYSPDECSASAGKDTLTPTTRSVQVVQRILWAM